jgi:hypothetical protein
VAACLAGGSSLEIDGGFALSAPGARFAAVQLGARVAVTIDGADAVEIELASAVDAVVVDGTPFPAAPAGSRLAFETRGPRWASRNGRRGG